MPLTTFTPARAEYHACLLNEFAEYVAANIILVAATSARACKHGKTDPETTTRKKKHVRESMSTQGI